MTSRTSRVKESSGSGAGPPPVDLCSLMNLFFLFLTLSLSPRQALGNVAIVAGFPLLWILYFSVILSYNNLRFILLVSCSKPYSFTNSRTIVKSVSIVVNFVCCCVAALLCVCAVCVVRPRRHTQAAAGEGERCACALPNVPPTHSRREAKRQAGRWRSKASPSPCFAIALHRPASPCIALSFRRALPCFALCHRPLPSSCL